jgi:hypothetical protein
MNIAASRYRHLSRVVSLLLLLPGSSLRADEVDCDVLVVGGGTAGVVAAIQAGRLGGKTVLVEAGSQMGGAATVGGVNSPILFNAHGAQRIKGIGWEWIIKTVRLDDGAMPESRQHWRINAPLFAIVAEELLRQAGVEIRYFEAPSRIEPAAQAPYRWTVTTSAMGATRTIRCKQIVDCTGNGAVCALAGAERMREAEIMPGTLNYTIKHAINLRKLDKAAIEKQFAEAVAKGEMLESDAIHGIIISLGYQAGNYVYDADNSTAKARTDTNLRGRQSVLRMLRFIRSLPGGETAQLVAMSPEVGVRETYRVKGEYVVTVDDYLSGKVWDDSIAFATYQVDLHKNLWKDFNRRFLPEGVVPTVPFRALIPKGKENLLVAGRCLSCDRLAGSGLRVQAVCMATGQAAGAAAALAAKKGITPAKVEMAELKASLKANGAIVPGLE